MKFLERLLATHEVPFSHDRGMYSNPRTVGSSRVQEILPFGMNTEFDIVMLDFKTDAESDSSQHVLRVPRGLFKVGDSAEVIVAEFEGSDYNVRGFPARRGKQVNSYAVVIRPFKPVTFGKPLDLDDPNNIGMLDNNIKMRHLAPDFFKSSVSNERKKRSN